jgi:6-pyruvoyl-tetrahydropterin synthase
MQYVRTYRFSAAHFNSSATYQLVWGWSDCGGDAYCRQDVVMLALADIHGHNFKIEVHVSGSVPKEGWLIDDVELEKVVMEWANTNLSMHPDFIDRKLRATTENMASLLYQKLNNGRFPAVEIDTVIVRETKDIFAVEQ